LTPHTGTLAAMFVALVLATAPRAHAATAHDDSMTSMLRDAAGQGVLAGLKWSRFPWYRDELQSLYSRSDWHPVWTSAGRPTAQARAAIDALLAAEERGLHPEDYDALLLDQQFRALSAGRSASARDVAWFDVAVSIGFLRHVSDVHIGRVNPKNLSIGINIESKKLDLAKDLREALDGGWVAEMLRDAEPTFVQYHGLKAAYARYRTLAARADVPAVAATQVVRPGDAFADASALRRRLAAMGDLGGAEGVADSAVYDTATATAVRRFQSRHGLTADGVLGPATLAAVNVPFATRQRQIELSLERIRWLPSFGRGPFVVVNVPSFQLYAFDSLNTTGVPQLTMNVVVGTAADASRQTPIFERDMQYIVFRPYWVITRNIIRNETMPAVRRNPAFLERNNMEIYSGSGDNGPALPASAENIERVAKGQFGFRQRPGAKNSLGLAKFIFPNDDNVYMHGTPATELFTRTRRDFSHGCIRLEDPARFAVWVLRDSGKWSAESVQRAMTDGEDSRRVNLERPLPVVIYYTTAVVLNDGTVAFYDDIYRHDERLTKELAKGYPYAP
jgi:L,D-transpeptidase YcbB